MLQVIDEGMLFLQLVNSSNKDFWEIFLGGLMVFTSKELIKFNKAFGIYYFTVSG